MPEDVRIDPNM